MKSIISIIKPKLPKLDEAFDYLSAFQEDGAQEDDESQGVIIAENKSLEWYQRFLDREPRLSVRIRLEDGKIKAYEVPSRHHGTVATLVVHLILIWGPQLTGASEPNITIGPRSLFTADAGIVPHGLPWLPPALACDSTGAPYPNLVIEVGFSESLPSLHRLAPGYFSARTTIQLFLAIKLFPPHGNGGPRAMLALLYVRTSPTPTVPVIAKSFGTAPLRGISVGYLHANGVPNATITGVGRHGAPACNVAGLPLYQVNLPAAALFHGAPSGIPAAAVGGFDLDLWLVQDAVVNP